MSLAVAVPLGVGSAIVYGTSIVFQHGEANKHNESDPRGLFGLLHNPLWLLAIAGDFIGFLLQIGALSTGSVVVVQPLVVLMLPVALIVGWLTGHHQPRLGDYLGSLAIITGLAVFLVLIGTPESAHVPRPRYIALAILIVLAIGLVGCLAVTGRRTVLRGAIYGAVAGAYFGTLGVMVDACSERFSMSGMEGLFASPRGLFPLIGAVLLGMGGIVLTQVSFQIGALAATLPANLAADPFTGVLIGALLLREELPVDVGHVIGYAFCLGAVIVGAVRLAKPATATHEPAMEPTAVDAA